MDCTEVGARMDPYIDNELEPEVKRELELHIASCGSCREGIDGALRFEQAVARRFPREQMPQELWTRLQKEIRAREHPRRRGILLALGLALAATMVFGVGLFWAAQTGRPDLERAVLDLHRRIEAGEKVCEMVPISPETTSEFLASQEEMRPFADRVARTLDIGAHHYIFVGVASVRMMERQFACLEYSCCGERICVVVMPSKNMDLFPGMQAALARAEGTISDSQGTTNFEARMIGEALVCFVGNHALDDLAVAYAGR